MYISKVKSCLLLQTFVIAGLLGSGNVLATEASKDSTASSSEYTIDQSHSRVGFVIRHLVSKVPGHFSHFEGNFSFDQKNPEKSKVIATVKAASVNTDNEKRDKHLRSDDFFAVEKFPTLKFESTKINPSKKDHYDMEGNLTMLGVTKPVKFDVEFLGQAKNPFGAGQRAGFVATANINRKDFGMKFNKALDNGGMMLSDDVEIQLNIEALEKAPVKQ